MNRKTVLALAVSASFGATPPMIFGQGVQQTEAIASSDALSQISTFSYRQGPRSDLLLRGTPIAATTRGKAQVEYQNDNAQIKASVENLPSMIARRRMLDGAELNLQIAQTRARPAPSEHKEEPMNTLPQTRHNPAPHGRAIQSLCDRTGASLAEVRDLFGSEFSRLKMGAKVGAYLAVLTESNVRGMLRRKARLSANAVRTP